MFTHAWSCRSHILFCAITFWWFAVMLQKVTCCPCILTLLMNALPEKLLLSSWYPQMCTLSAFAYDSNSLFAFIVSFIVCHFACIPSSLEKWSTNTIAAVYFPWQVPNDFVMKTLVDDSKELNDTHSPAEIACFISFVGLLHFQVFGVAFPYKQLHILDCPPLAVRLVACEWFLELTWSLACWKAGG